MDDEGACRISQGESVRRISAFTVVVLVVSSYAAAQTMETAPERVEQSIYTRSEHPALFDAVKLRTTDLLEAAVSVEDKGGKVTYAPFLYGLLTYRALLSETRLQVSQKDNQTTLGMGVLYNPTSPRSARGVRRWNATADSKSDAPAILQLRSTRATFSPRIDQLTARIRQAPTATSEDMAQLAVLNRDLILLNAELAQLNADLATLEEAETKRINERILRYDEELVATTVPVIGVNYNATLFQILGGTTRDADNDGLEDNARKVKRHSVAVSADTRPSMRFMLSALGVFEWERANAEEGVHAARFWGYGFTAGGIVMILNPNYRESDDYRASLFIPSVVLGGAVEERHCREAEQSCPDGKTREVAFTPFVDFKIARAAQFRVGFPIKRITTAGTLTTELGTVTSFSLQLGQPK